MQAASRDLRGAGLTDVDAIALARGLTTATTLAVLGIRDNSDISEAGVATLIMAMYGNTALQVLISDHGMFMRRGVAPAAAGARP